MYISVLFLLVKSNHAKVHDQSCESPFPAFRGRILETFLHGTSCYHRRPNSLTCKHGRGERLRAPSGPKQTCCPGIETVGTLGQIWKHRGSTSWYPGVHLGWVMLVSDSQILDFGWSVFFHIKLWGKSRWIIAKYCNYMGKDIRAMWGESPNFWGALSIQGLDDSNCFNDAEKTHWTIEKLDTPDLETRAFIISSTSQKSNSFQENLKSVQTHVQLWKREHVHPTSFPPTMPVPVRAWRPATGFTGPFTPLVEVGAGSPAFECPIRTSSAETPPAVATCPRAESNTKRCTPFPPRSSYIY